MYNHTIAARRLAATALAIATLNPVLDLAQPSIADFAALSEEKKFYYVSGYLDGFGFAAQMPPEKSAPLQKCFGDFEPQRPFGFLSNG